MKTRTRQNQSERPNKKGRSFPYREKKSLFSLHPLFLLFGAYYCIKGELFIFLLSALVAIQHECAHAFAAAKLGYKLNKIVLMPFGAVIDGDLKGISLKDEIFVAACGPLCNLITALFFLALWWLTPTMYAFTDTAYFSSIAIALVNLLPAYPLDGGRILRCLLAKSFLKNNPDEQKAERKAEKIGRFVTLGIALLLTFIFIGQCAQNSPNVTLLAFAIFLFVGAFGTSEKDAVYGKMNISLRGILKKGIEVRYVAVLDSIPIKDCLRFLAKGSYLVLVVYDEGENFLFELPQNQLSTYLLRAKSPYDTLRTVHNANFLEK